MGTEFKGVTASDGLFMGPVSFVSRVSGRRPYSGDPMLERIALRAALAQAIAELVALTGNVESEAADILGFQVAMLEDDALSAPALAAMDKGVAADLAWPQAIDNEIEGYENSEDQYFKARAADLKDMRDRVLRHLCGESASATVTQGMVLAGDDLAPTLFLETDWSKGGGIALGGGSSTSHVAMLARARGIPMVVGLGENLPRKPHLAIVDGMRGSVIFDPGPEDTEIFYHSRSVQAERNETEDRYRFAPARCQDGTRIDLLINVASVEELELLDPRTCDGIGLMRSEFLFRDGAPLPDEEEQYRAYRRFIEWADGRPVTIRTLDIGGDKPISGLTPSHESNPFLGLRGVRLTLAREDVFRSQLRALARAAAHGALKVMIPMVTIPEELARSAALLDQCVGELRGEGVACKRPPLGIMVEVPAVAITPELFRNAAFFSIGSNDLTQYVTATSRDDPRVASLNDAGHPAVTKLIASVAHFGRENAIPISLCGDMASDPKHLRRLLDAGLTSLSVAPSRTTRIKAALAEL